MTGKILAFHDDCACFTLTFSTFKRAILTILNGGYHKNQVICPDISYDLIHSWPSIHQISCKYSHSVVAILKIQNGGRYSSQITCLHFLYDSNNKKLSIHKISCFYDNLNNIAINRSTISTAIITSIKA